MKKVIIVLLLFTITTQAKMSQCFGTTSQGRIENSVQLSIKGENFIIYNSLGNLLGRNYVHSKVYDAVVNSYKQLAQSFPRYKYKYGETGWKNGGEFKPHKTHQNGLSVDFMVPVIDEKMQPVYFPSNLSNKFGYGVEFGSNGKYGDYSIDYEALAVHLVQLHKESLKQDIEIRRVIFAPEYRSILFQTTQGKYLQENLSFMKNKAWIRHDEHYHVDFKVKCKN
jgi:penicillin-insensitive murein endopeptidase